MMTPNEQRIAIAEWMGWKDINGNKSADFPHFGTDIYGCRHEIPNYPEDLNAMHEAEKKLTINERIVYVRILHLRGGDNTIADFILMHKIANERSEALCRTLWPERFE